MQRTSRMLENLSCSFTWHVAADDSFLGWDCPSVKHARAMNHREDRTLSLSLSIYVLIRGYYSLVMQGQ